MEKTVPENVSPAPDEAMSDEEIRRAELIWSTMSDERKIEMNILVEEDQFSHPLIKAFLSYHAAVCSVGRGFFREARPAPDYSGPIQWSDQFLEFYEGFSSVIWLLNCRQCAGILPAGYARRQTDEGYWVYRLERRFDLCPYCHKSCR